MCVCVCGAPLIKNICVCINNTGTGCGECILSSYHEAEGSSVDVDDADDDGAGGDGRYKPCS